jgi:hypothetical protein
VHTGYSKYGLELSHCMRYFWAEKMREIYKWFGIGGNVKTNFQWAIFPFQTGTIIVSLKK